MHLSRSHSDMGKLDRGDSTSGLPPRPGAKQVEHPAKYEFPSNEKFSAAAAQSPAQEFCNFSGWKKGGWTWLLDRIFPCMVWMRTYKWDEYFRDDLIAGLTVGTMLVPQSMSYARLAGLHPIYGLYAGFVPVLTYAVFGCSRQLGVGPVAMVSLLVSNGLLSVVNFDEAQTEGALEDAQKLYTQLAIQLALMVGIIDCLLGLLRLGWLIRFISHSVVSGFTTASAIIIALSQIGGFLGYEISRSSELLVILQSIMDGVDKFMWQPFVMGSVTLGYLLLMKHLGKTYKKLSYLRAAGPITSIVLGVLFVKVFRPASIKVVGTVPQGFPSLSLGFNFEYGVKLLPHAFLVTGVGVLESVGIAKTLASKNGYVIDSNQELFGLGLSNLFGSAFSGFPMAGSFSRSAVMNDSGAKTGLSGIVVFFLIGASLLFLTPVFTDIPQCGLAAIVISAVIGLLDYEEAFFLWRVAKRDLVLWVAASVFTLFLGIEVGVLVGVALSLLFVIYESANPHTAILGRLPGTTVYRNIKQYPDAYSYNGIVIIRVDAPMYFANIHVVKERLCVCEYSKGNRQRPGVRVSYIIFDMSPVTYIDSSAVHAIVEFYYNKKARGIQLALCNPGIDVMKTLTQAGIPELIGREWFFVRVHDAVQACLAHSKILSIKHASLTAEESEDITVFIDDVCETTALLSDSDHHKALHDS